MSRSKIFITIILSIIVLFSAVLRLLWLDRFPPSLYTDEANQGYNAYSILLTGRDEHGAFFPVSLRSFGDWKPPLSAYLMIPFIYKFGLNEFTVRLPSALLGVGTVILTFFLVRELFKEKKEATLLAILASFFLSISPWHILQSRSAMLVTVSLFFLEGGIYFFIKGIKNSKLFILSSLFFALSLYAYYGLRVIMPLVLLILFFHYRKNLFFLRRKLVFPFLIGLFLLVPLFYSFLKTPDVILGRAKTVSVFYDQGVKLRQWELIAQDGIGATPIISRFFHNNLIMYGRSIIQRFLSHFDGRFLFLTGDKAQPFQIPNMGILYLLDGIFFFAGLIILYKRRYSSRNIIVLLLLISIFPASLTFMTPSGNRTFNAVIPFVILVSLGLVRLLKLTPRKRLTASSISVLYAISFGYFLHQYFQILPVKYADWWNYGWKEAVEYIQAISPKYKNVIVSDVSGMPYIYFLFYGKYPPSRYQKESIRTYVADRFGFEHVEGFDKYLFISDFNWKYTKENLQKKTIYVVPANQAPDDNGYIKAISYPNAKTAIKIFAYE